MKHPNRDEWVPFIFGEADPSSRGRLAAHLESCPDCAAEVASWRRTLRRLDRWQAPSPAQSRIVAFPLLKWALAAALVLGAGFLLGRLSGPTHAQVAQWRGQIEGSLRTSLQAEMDQTVRAMQDQTKEALATMEHRLAQASTASNQLLARQVAEAIRSTRQEDQQATQALFRQFQARHESDVIALRKDLETLASTADQELRQAHFNLTQLAALTQNTPAN